MEATGTSPPLSRHRLAVSLAGALVAAATFIPVGPAAARGHSTDSDTSQLHTYDFDAPSSAAVVGADLFVTNGGSNSVTEVSAANGAYVALISAKRYRFNRPSAIAAVGGNLFVANGGGNSLTEFSAANLKHIHTIRRSKYHFWDPVALASSGQDLFVLNGSGSVTEITGGTGALIGTVSGPAFGFHNPTGLAVAAGKVFVANPAVNTVTVFSAETRALIAILSGSAYGFDTPTGVAFDGHNVWVTNQNDKSVTEISASTLQDVNVLASSNLPWVGPITYGDGYVFTVSPPGGSPMVSQIVPSPAAVTWMMCNTNGPYLFNDPEAAVVTGSSLWVVNRGGNSLTEMDADSGALIRTIP